MDWETALLSGVVAAIVSTLAAWFTGLHRDRRAADQQTAHRREDVRRERLTDAVVDFLAADRQRFESTRFTLDSLAALESGVHDEGSQQSMARELLAGFKPHLDAAANAAQRIGLYAPGLYDLARCAHVLMDDGEDRGRRHEEYQALVDELAAAARTEVGIVPSPQQQTNGSE